MTFFPSGLSSLALRHTELVTPPQPPAHPPFSLQRLSLWDYGTDFSKPFTFFFSPSLTQLTLVNFSVNAPSHQADLVTFFSSVAGQLVYLKINVDLPPSLLTKFALCGRLSTLDLQYPGHILESITRVLPATPGLHKLEVEWIPEPATIITTTTLASIFSRTNLRSLKEVTFGSYIKPLYFLAEEGQQLLAELERRGVKVVFVSQW